MLLPRRKNRNTVYSKPPPAPTIMKGHTPLGGGGSSCKIITPLRPESKTYKRTFYKNVRGVLTKGPSLKIKIEREKRFSSLPGSTYRTSAMKVQKTKKRRALIATSRNQKKKRPKSNTVLQKADGVSTCSKLRVRISLGKSKPFACPCSGRCRVMPPRAD